MTALMFQCSAFVLTLGAGLALWGCGGSASSTPSSSGNGPTLTSLSISPLNPSTDVEATLQFFATANFSDKSTRDVTASADWSSSDNAIATIQTSGQANPGMATSVSLGPVTVTATYNGVKGSSGLTVVANAARVPLMDMISTQNYLGFQGGLYENVSDTLPSDHAAAGLAAASAIQPLDTNGNPSPAGKVVLVALGRSTVVDEFSVFVAQAGSNAAVNHTSLIIANGAQTGSSPCVWEVPNGPPPCEPTFGNPYDFVRDSVLAPLAVTEKQVQVVWIEEYNPDPAGSGFQSLCDPSSGCTNSTSTTEALRFEQQLGGILRAAKTRWSNLRQAFNSSRMYAGYAATDHNSEPYAYEYAFAVKWLVEAQVEQMRSASFQSDPVAGDLNYASVIAPWTAWGPYTWANGAVPRSDGLVWCNGQAGPPCNGEVDFQSDGIHPDAQGAGKVANLLMNFLLNSPLTPWFRP